VSLWERFLYAGVFTAVLNAIVILVLAIAAPESATSILKELNWVVFVELALAFVLAPTLSRYFPRKRGRDDSAI